VVYSNGSTSRVSKKPTVDKPGELVQIVWIDSAQLLSDGVWSAKEDVLEISHDYILSVGFVVKETEENIVLVAHVSETEFSGEMCIPKAAVIDRVPLKVVKKRKPKCPTTTL
jgi:hypothetical protein